MTAKTIAEEFEICTRTVYRDIQDLMNSGAPISGEAGVGYIIDKQYYLPPVTFDADELEAIGLGISMVRHWSDERFAKKADSAFAKIQAVLPANLQGELEQITTYSIPNQSAFNQTELPWTVSFSDLRECIRNRRKIRITYTDLSQRDTLRILHPLALIFCGPIWLLATWCEKRNDFRNFRLDRIKNVEICEDIFDDEKDKNLSAYKAQDALC
ncbi:MAG: YafY family transcriptional regulator [Devosiaceae bacterium]|nr:YafY family transcriptional regulator [Devosiaceae bacterium]